jgi:hypothetical protein
MLSWILEKFTNWIESICTKFAKVIKEIGNQKKKRKKRRKKHEKGPGQTIWPSSRSGPRPRKPILNQYAPFSLTRWQLGSTYQGHIIVFLPHPKFSPETTARWFRSLVKFRWLRPSRASPFASIKGPGAHPPSPSPFPSRKHRQAALILRGRPAVPPPFVIDCGNTVSPQAPSLALSSLPHSGDRTDAFLLTKHAADWCNHRHPEDTSARSHSSQSSSPMQD